MNRIMLEDRLKEIDAKLICNVISGSHAYGLNIPTSDVDYRGVYIQSNDKVLADNITKQIDFNNNDMTYYEIGRFIDLLCQGNPNILELYGIAEKELSEYLPPVETFFTKKLKNSFGGYAIQQIKKARGLNKKIVNPQPEVRKSPLEFCYIIEGQKSYDLKDFIGIEDIKTSGLAKCENGHNLYTIYIDTKNKYNFKGICSENGNDLKLTSIPKEATYDRYVMRKHLYFNHDGYKVHCKEWGQYWSWVKLRNDARYADTEKHGKGFDGKNMMHCFRLLYMARDIITENKLVVKRPEREFLLSIRKGKVDYDELIEMSELLLKEVEQLFDNSNLPEDISKEFRQEIKLKIRKANA